MRRLEIKPRKGWEQKLEAMGLLYHTAGEPYWNEFACYELTLPEVDVIEKATNTLHELCIKAVEAVIERDWFERLHLTPREKEMIVSSWDKDQLSVYGRFDLSWDGVTPPKMLEYNADTPTSIFEAAIVQWDWLMEVHPGHTQFNSLHEKLKARWPKVASPDKTLHFLCVKGSAEDIAQTEYLRDVAHQSGLKTEFLFIEDLGWDERAACFVDLESQKVQQAFKLYPWEWLMNEDFGRHLFTSEVQMIEPAWKRLLSSKGILPILWELFPDHPNLLPAFFEQPSSGDFVKKPMQSREGSNISVVKNGVEILKTEGAEYSPGYVYQKYHGLPKFLDKYAVIGSWIIGEEAAGIGIREDISPVTRNLSQFVPHFIGEERNHSWI